MRVVTMKNHRHNIFLTIPLCIFILIVLFHGKSAALLQNTVVQAAEDTIISQPDTVQSVGFISKIHYEAEDSIVYDFDNAIISLYGTESKLAKITYEDMTLEAMRIFMYMSGDSIVAVGVTVPADKDSFPDGFKLIGKPVFTQEGQEPLTGLRMVYNLQTKKAKILEGRTKFEGGFYYGENITRIDEDHLQIVDGYYTTCDKEEPHFHFKSSRMKLKIRDKIVAKPVIFYIHDVPVFFLPFGVFPVHGGRSSGFIMPSYGESLVEGRHLRGIGYYYAPNDYMDAKLLMDYYEKSGIMFRGDARYNVRYKMSGNISGSITRKNFADQKLSRWDLRIIHNQIIDPTLNLSVNGNFISDKSFNRQFKLNRNERSLRRIYSTANLVKRWEDSKNSLRVTVTRTQDLQTGRIDETLPSIFFNRSTPTYLFRRESDSKQRGAGLTPEKEPFYSNLSFRYDSKLINKRSKSRLTEDEPFKRTTRSGIEHNLSFAMPTRLFTYISINPSLRYREEWYSETIRKRVDDRNNVITDKEKGFFVRRTGSFSVGLNTKLYGLFNPNIGSLRSIRHVMTPSLSFSYRLDFSDPAFGYYATYSDTSGKEIEYDRFGDALFGRTSLGKSKSMSMSLQNLFQVKTLTGETENKFDLLNISMSTSYNFAAPPNSRKLSDLSTSIRLMKYANLVLNTVHSFYEFDPVLKRRTNTFLFDTSSSWWKKRFIQLTSLSASTSIRLKSRQPEEQQAPVEEIESEPFDEEFAVTKTVEEDLQDRFEDRSGLARQVIPWEFQMSFQFRLNRYDPTNVRKVFTSRGNLSVKVTENWNVGYDGSFDLREKRIVYHDLKIYRDLHCWELSFNWTPPNSSRSGFWLEIRVKEPKLQDLKIRKTDYGGSAIGYR